MKSNNIMKKLFLSLWIFTCLLSYGQQKALVINGEIIRTGLPTMFERSNGQTVWGSYQKMPDSVHYIDGWRNVIIPDYDPATQRLGQRYFDVEKDVVTYSVTNKTQQELQAEKDAIIDMLDDDVNFLAIKRLLQIIAKPLLESEEIRSDLLSDLTSIYPQYRIDQAYKTDAVFVKDSILYRVLQSHTSQSDWPPETTGSLYTPYRAPGEISDWIQPTGAHDAYQTGDKVNFKGKTYESVIDNNTWAPDVYPSGWKLITTL